MFIKKQNNMTVMDLQEFMKMKSFINIKILDGLIYMNYKVFMVIVVKKQEEQ